MKSEKFEEILKGPYKIIDDTLYIKSQNGNWSECYNFPSKVNIFTEVINLPDRSSPGYFFVLLPNENLVTERTRNILFFDDGGNLVWQIEAAGENKKTAFGVYPRWDGINLIGSKLCALNDASMVFEIDPKTGKVLKFLYQTK